MDNFKDKSQKQILFLEKENEKLSSKLEKIEERYKTKTKLLEEAR